MTFSSNIPLSICTFSFTDRPIHDQATTDEALLFRLFILILLRAGIPAIVLTSCTVNEIQTP